MALAIWAEVFTPVGPFTGYASGSLADEKAANDEISKLQGILRENCTQFVIYGTSDEEITFQADVVKGSVFKFSIATV
jgi:hypothetical protein